MKTKMLILFTVISMLLSATPALAAAAPNHPEELAYIDAQVNVMLPMLSQFQMQYYFVNGRYYQALISHASPPAVPVVPSGISASPTDQPESLAYFWNFASLPGLLAWSFSIDTYCGPDGCGYVLNVFTTVNDQEWSRSVNYGPDTWRGSDWYLVEE